MVFKCTFVIHFFLVKKHLSAIKIQNWKSFENKIDVLVKLFFSKFHIRNLFLSFNDICTRTATCVFTWLGISSSRQWKVSMRCNFVHMHFKNQMHSPCSFVNLGHSRASEFCRNENFRSENSRDEITEKAAYYRNLHN